MNEEIIRSSDGSWHRDQRKRVAFETACYYTSEPTLPYGCQYHSAKTTGWNDRRRQEEQTALEDFYWMTGGPAWRSNDNWMDGNPCWDQWYGVTCDEHGHVVALELMDNKLLGAFPTSFSKLLSLVKLDLSSGQVDYHSHVNEYTNRMRGAMPSLSGCLHLEEIEVSGNEIDALPADLYMNAATLKTLSASHNRIRALPRYWSRYKRLHTLELNHNDIGEQFPADIDGLRQLRFLELSHNRLRGTIPRAIKELRFVQVMDVSKNADLSGELPEEVIVTWTDVKYLSIMDTALTGYIAQLCLDVPLCFKFMYDTHGDLSMAGAGDVPDIVNLTMTLAQR